MKARMTENGLVYILLGDYDIPAEYLLFQNSFKSGAGMMLEVMEE